MVSPRMALLLISAFLAAATAAAAEFKPGEVIVKYKDGVVRSRVNMNAMYDALGVKTVRRYTGLMKGFEHLILNDTIKVQDAIAALQQYAAVDYAQPNYIVRTKPIQQPVRGSEGGIPCIPGMDIPDCDPNAPMPCLIPGIPFPPGCQDGGDSPIPPPGGDDPSNPPAERPAVQDPPAEVNPPVDDADLAKAYGLAKIGATEAWGTHKGDKKFVVAVIDTGIDYNHEDLSFNVWRNPNPTDKNDVVGFDFVHNDGLPFDDNQHGTHTSGTVGAVGGNGKGVSGVSQRVSIMGLKFLSGEGSGTTSDAVRAIDYAVEHGAKVLSNSWGGKGDSGNAALEEAIKRAMARDVLFIAAAGNDSADNDGSNADYPAAFRVDNLISVAATDNKDGVAFFSNYGKESVHLAAPGVNVYSTVPGNRYSQLSGTSMACPHVAGAAALLWSKNPSWNYKKVKDVLLQSVDKIPALASKTVTGGRLNILKALRSTE